MANETWTATREKLTEPDCCRKSLCNFAPKRQNSVPNLIVCIRFEFYCLIIQFVFVWCNFFSYTYILFYLKCFMANFFSVFKSALKCITFVIHCFSMPCDQMIWNFFFFFGITISLFILCLYGKVKSGFHVRVNCRKKRRWSIRLIQFSPINTFISKRNMEFPAKCKRFIKINMSVSIVLHIQIISYDGWHCARFFVAICYIF